MSKTTVTARDQRSASEAVLMLAFELGEDGWLLGFSTGFGQRVLQRKVGSRDREAVLRAIEWARGRLGCENSRVVSCYEAGRDGFWLHRWLGAEGIESRIIDASSIEVNRRRKRVKTDRLDVTKLLGLLARYRAGERDAFSIVSVPSVEEEDLRHVGRELKLMKKDRTRVSHRMKGLLANQGLTIDLRKDLRGQLEAMRRWNGEPLPRHLRERLEHYCDDFQYHTRRIRDLEQRRRELMRAKESPAVEKTWRMFQLRGVGIESSWTYGTELFGWREFRKERCSRRISGWRSPRHPREESADLRW